MPLLKVDADDDRMLTTATQDLWFFLVSNNSRLIKKIKK